MDSVHDCKVCTAVERQRLLSLRSLKNRWRLHAADTNALDESGRVEFVNCYLRNRQKITELYWQAWEEHWDRHVAR